VNKNHTLKESRSVAAVGIIELQTNPPSISVVVPCRGHANELKNCLRGLHQQTTTSPYEIIVVDSAADPAVAAVVTAFPTVRLVHSQSGLLPGGARNLGAQHARGDYIAFTDADCIPESGWLSAAIAALNTDATVVGGPVLDARPFHPLAVADNLLQFPDLSPHRPDGTASYFPGCNFAISRVAFYELGEFLTDLAAGEDVLFVSAAATRWPGDVRFVRGMRVRHIGRTHLRAFWRHQEVFGFYRGRLGLRLRPIHQRLGGRAMLAVPIACKRLGYIVFRTVQWNPVGLLRIIVLLPILLLGLVAWVKGFRRGCRMATIGKVI
jgi:glycosyltransferase involved in cell wall biosynthesis